MLAKLKQLGGLGWFEVRDDGAVAPDVWRRTAHGFDVGWTETTREERFEVSRQIAQERLDHIAHMLGAWGTSLASASSTVDAGRAGTST